jgi:hypothetical protein
MAQSPVRINGARIGALIGAVGGVLFIVFSAGVLPSPWSTITVATGIFGFLWVVWLILRVPDDPDAYQPDARQMQAFWIVVALEVVAIFAGSNVAIHVLDRPDASLPWIATVLGLHWLAFRLVFQEDVFLWLGWFVLSCGIVGLMVAILEVGPSGSSAIASGMLTGLVMLGCVGIDASRRRGRLLRRSASRRPPARNT